MSSDRHQIVREKTVRAELAPGVNELSKNAALKVDVGLARARKSLREGFAGRAFSEAIRVGREVPLNGRLAAHLVRFALAARTDAAAITFLEAGVDDAEGEEHFAIRRRLSRLFRRTSRLAESREQLAIILAEHPGDRPARRMLDALLEREHRWEELDASLEKQTKEALAEGRRDRAARAAVARASLARKLGRPAQAALRWGQAAQLLEQIRAHRRAFEIRLRWLGALVEAESAQGVLDQALELSRVAAERVDAFARWKAAVREMGLVPESSHPHTPIHFAGRTPVSRRPTPVPAERARTLEMPAMELESLTSESTPEPTADPPQARTELAMPAVAAPPAVPEPSPPPKPSALELRRTEARLVAAGEWTELATFYRNQVDSVSDGPARLELLSRLAEVLESELGDPRGAAEAYGRMVMRSGDARALREQVRIYDAEGDAAALEEALDRAAKSAPDVGCRAESFGLRGERALAKGASSAARADFLAALRLEPRHLGAKIGLADAAAREGELRPLRALLEPVPAVSRKHSGRAELFRRLARLADQHLPELSRTAWNEVRGDLPDDDEAQARLAALAREGADDEGLEPLLRAALAREPRGPEARRVRLELVAILERLGRPDDALVELRQAIRFEPGHKEAWLLLADRREADGALDEAAWALEQAATAMDDQQERARTWERLAAFCRTALEDPERAEIYARRAENARALAEPPPPPVEVMIPSPPALELYAHPRTDELSLPGPPEPEPPPPHVAPEKPRKSGVRRAPRRASTRPQIPAGLTPTGPGLPEPLGEVTPTGPGSSEARFTEPTPTTGSGELVRIDYSELAEPTRVSPLEGSPEAVADSDEASEKTPLSAHPLDQDAFERIARGDALPEPAPEGDEVPAWDAPPAELERQKMVEDLVSVSPAAELSPVSSGLVVLSDLDRRAKRDELAEKLSADPSNPEGYRALEAFFESVPDAPRATLMREIADALEGHPVPGAPPERVYGASERAGLRHPSLRNEAGELLSLIGLAVLKGSGLKVVPGLTREEFRLDSGRGAKSLGEALVAAVKALCVRAPELLVSDFGPPLELVFQGAPKIAVSQVAIRKAFPEDQLRFFAGRALFSLEPELLVLQTLDASVIARGLHAVGAALGHKRGAGGRFRVLREAIPAKGRERAASLLGRHAREIDLGVLAEGARDSANRAGMLVAGGIGPALTALRTLKASRREVLELLRFAASERWLSLRGGGATPESPA